jgi:hypothetical protein
MGNCKTKFVLTPILSSYPTKNIEKFENEIMKDDVWKITPIDYYETKKINNTYKSTLIYTFPKKYSQDIIFDINPPVLGKESNNEKIKNEEKNENKQEQINQIKDTENNLDEKEKKSSDDKDTETVHKIYTNNLGIIYVKKPKYREAKIDPNFCTPRKNSRLILNYLQTNN